MADPQLFHDKLRSLQPDENLKPDTVFVAVLRHDCTPLDNLLQPNALWVKCPKHKEVAALKKAYAKQPGYDVDICIRHDFKVIDNRTSLKDLCNRSPDFIALEAVRISDLTRRNALLTSHRNPLQDVTNQPRQTSALDSKDRDSKERSTPLPAQRTAVSITPSAGIPTQSFCSATSHPANGGEADGWVDFAYERREHSQRSANGDKCSSNPETRHRNQEFATEWLALNPGQKSYFVERSKKVLRASGFDNSVHRAFWCFYYDIYFERRTRLGLDSHFDFRTTQTFTDAMITAWRTMNDTQRSTYLKRTVSALVENPASAVPTQAPIAHTPDVQPPRASSAPAIKDEQRGASVDSSINDAARPPTPSPSDRQQSSQPEQEEAAVRLNLTDLFIGRTPEQLEKSVDKGVEMLQQIRQALESQPSQDSTQWLQTIDNVQKQAVRTKTVVGVVGATGAGKSSVINAMLDEERLVPTNCMRACTAVVTEISYNHSEDVRYRAEIEFIARQDWAKELKVLFQDLFDGSGQVSRDCTNEDSDAGIAYAKIRAVYPKLTKEDMTNATIEKLMQHGNVNCLGTERSLENDDSLVFYRKLQYYVDSKEKSTAKDKFDKEKTREMEFWPLIKVVRLYVKAPALATGAVIVDLPGVHDSNQARAAVAQNYMKACTGLWIVAPITRAVDDKSAKTLLGDSFKRQLKMDGGYSSVTFICSKTDAISLTEAQDSLGLEDEMGPLYAKSEELRKAKRVLQKKMSDLKDTKGDISGAMETADEELEVWEKLQEQQSEGQTVYKPNPQSDSKKRKRADKKSPSRKKSKYTEPDTDDDFIDDDIDSASDAGSDYAAADADEDRGEPLTEDAITNKIAELRTTKKIGRSEKAQIDEQIKAARREIQQLDTEQGAIDAQLSAKCISGRNEYSRSAIQKDFAAGIKELDQELAEEEDAANFNPEVDARDYDEVARSLPVFCVSSRAYQKLKGRLLKDKAVPGFENVDETEIPKLQAHCRKLTEAGREAACKRFLTNLTQLLNSLRLWSSNDGSGRNLTDAQLKREAKVLNEKLDKLDIALEKCVKSVIQALGDELQDSIYDAFPNAIASAKSQAINTARQWGSPVNRNDRPQGGLYWATYKAVVRRDGCFTNAQGLHDFNEELTEPIIRHVAGPWEKIFSRRLPPVLSGLSSNGGTLLTKFHNDVETRAVKNGASIAAFQMLKQQLPVYKETLKDASSTVKNEITTKQRDINREFVPAIKDSMLDVYNECLMESGPGQFNRMKGHMDRHVERVKQSMFDESSEGVKDLLTAMLKEAKKSLMDKTDEIFMALKRDYTGVVVGQDEGDQAQLLPREQRALRKAVLDIVDGAELAFKRAVGLEPEEEPEETSEAGDKEDVDASNKVQDPATEETEIEGVPIVSTGDEVTTEKVWQSSSMVDDEVSFPTTFSAEAASIATAPAGPDTAEDPLAALLRPNTLLSAIQAEAQAAIETRASSVPAVSGAADEDAKSQEDARAQSAPIKSGPATDGFDIARDASNDEPMASVADSEPVDDTARAQTASTSLAPATASADIEIAQDATNDDSMADEPSGEDMDNTFPEPATGGFDIAQDAPADEPVDEPSPIPGALAKVENVDAQISAFDGQEDEKDDEGHAPETQLCDLFQSHEYGSDKENNGSEVDGGMEDTQDTQSSAWSFHYL